MQPLPAQTNSNLPVSLNKLNNTPIIRLSKRRRPGITIYYVRIFREFHISFYPKIVSFLGISNKIAPFYGYFILFIFLHYYPIFLDF